jgi:hypothetical protein
VLSTSYGTGHVLGLRIVRANGDLPDSWPFDRDREHHRIHSYPADQMITQMRGKDH